MARDTLKQKLEKYSGTFHEVVSFNPSQEKLIPFDFTKNNEALQKINFLDTGIFSQYVNGLLQKANAKFGIGGYDELRILYSRSSLFDDDVSRKDVESGEPRRLHLGIDIWGQEGTKIFSPLAGIVHSFAFNDNFGDYGATIILQHQLDGIFFYTLYGHVGLDNLRMLKQGDNVKKGQQFAHFGKQEENGHWPPHLHFQVIRDIGNYNGDYPGVCKLSEREKYLDNCPNPDLILNMNSFQEK